MPKDKHEKGADPSSSQKTNHENKTLGTLHVDTASEVAKYLPLKEMGRLAKVSRQNYLFFQPILDDAKIAFPLLTAVVQANPAELELFIMGDSQALLNYAQNNLERFLQLIKSYSAEITKFKNQEIDLQQLVQSIAVGPELLFQKGQVKDPAGQRFYNVSPYQLMTFLGDARMKQEIMSLVMPMTETMEKIRLAQYKEIDCGGPDLVKIDQDPTHPLFDFNAVLHHRETYTPIQATFPLLENPDGLIYYKEPGDTGKARLYYANRTSQTVKEVLYSPTEQPDLVRLIASMDRMENNSSRRSSDEEHCLIARILCVPNTDQPLALHRKGIQYDDCEGVRYCDSRIDFNRYYNTNRQCIRLYDQGKWDEGDSAWIELGKRQRELMWRLQFLCQEKLPFYPTPNFSDLPNRREFKYYNLNRKKDELVFGPGGLTGDFGSKFTLYKGTGVLPARGGVWCAVARVAGVQLGQSLALDLVAVCRLVEGEKSAVNEFKPEQDSPQNAGLNP